MVIIRPSKKTVSEKEVEHLEADIKARFPSEYRQFLLTYNTGIPEPNSFPVGTPNATSGVSTFLGISDQRFQDIKYGMRLLKGRLPDRFVPIAECSCGDMLWLCLDESEDGSVYYWDHEREDPNDTRAALYRVAASLTEFLSLMSPLDSS